MGQHSLNSSVLVIFPHWTLSPYVLKLILPVWISDNSLKVIFFQSVPHSANTRLFYCYLALTVLLKKGYSNEVKPKYSSNFIRYDEHNSRQLCESHSPCQTSLIPMPLQGQHIFLWKHVNEEHSIRQQQLRKENKMSM